MGALSLKKYWVLGLLAAGGLMGMLSGCGRKEYQQVSGGFDAQRLSIGEELQWRAGFDWLYFSYDDSADGEKTGYFKQKEGVTKGAHTFKAVVSEETKPWHREDVVEVSHTMLSEGDFFALVNSHASELADNYPERDVVYRINGSAETEQFVQLDTNAQHWLYMRDRDSVYILYGKMPKSKWQDFLEDWLFAFELKWDGATVMKEDGTVLDTYTGKKWKGLRSMFQYGEDCMEIYRNVILFHRQEDGFYFKMESKDEEKKLVEELVLRPSDIGLEYDGWEEAVSCFAARYPDMCSLEANLYGEDTLWNPEGRASDRVFYKIEEMEYTRGFFFWNGRVFEMSSRGMGSYYNTVDMVGSSIGYDYHTCFLWEREEDGSIVYEDNLAGKYSYIKDWGNGKLIRLQAEIVNKESGELLDTITYGVKIFDEKGGKILQEIQMDSSYAHGSPFEFEDFNADGYLDITVTYYYGANGGTASHYIYSPSKEEFVEADPELDYYGMYSVDHETRRLYMHYHGSAVDGREITYQWKNEMDYEMVKQFDHDCRDDCVQVKITRYENGEEEVLSDYCYAYEEYTERGDIWGTYYEDFIWEKEVTDKSTGKKYMIRYAEVFQPEEAEKNNGIYYDGRIFVYDEDTYLVSVTHSEIISESESIEWEDGSSGQEQALVIHYVDGGESAFYLSGLIRPDYRPPTING